LITNIFGWWQFVHAINGALVAAAILMAAIGAYYLLVGRNIEFARLSVKLGLIAGVIFSITQVFPTGDENARNVLSYQPVKQAAYEGLFTTQSNAPLSVIGFPSTEQHRLLDAIEVPGLLSFLSYGETRKTVVGLNAFPSNDWPPVQVTYYAYHLMIALGTLFVAVMLLGIFLLWRRRLYDSRWFLWILMLMLPLPYIANEAGWVVTEVGRQPWLIWGVMKTAQGYSPTVVAGQTIFTLLGFFGIYTLLGILFLFLVGRQVSLGPDGAAHTAETDLAAQAQA
jgi:cytochrome d ubiquinol oxidase subunit I